MDTGQTEVIHVRGLTFTYPKLADPAVRGMNFSVGRGEIFGSSGQRRGEVHDPEASDRAAAESRRRCPGLGKDPLAWGSDYYQRIGVSFQLPNHYQKLTGLETLRFFPLLYYGETPDPQALLRRWAWPVPPTCELAIFEGNENRRLMFAWLFINDPELAVPRRADIGVGSGSMPVPSNTLSWI